MDQDRQKHLEFIQQTISRLAGNSFVVKGWSVTIVAALLALSASKSQQEYQLIAFLPALCFWGLDAYYLRQERLFRALYDVVRHPDSPVDPYSMNTSVVAEDVPGTIRSLFATVVLLYHLPVIAAISAAIWYL